jgi:hypothetical protein
VHSRDAESPNAVDDPDSGIQGADGVRVAEHVPVAERLDQVAVLAALDEYDVGEADDRLERRCVAALVRVCGEILQVAEERRAQLREASLP